MQDLRQIYFLFLCLNLVTKLNCLSGCSICHKPKNVDHVQAAGRTSSQLIYTVCIKVSDPESLSPDPDPDLALDLDFISDLDPDFLRPKIVFF
jgi:hypothetical protein